MSQSRHGGSPGNRIGQILAHRYEIVRFLGAGGMGEVYEARHTIIGRRFAVKVLHSHLADREHGEFAQRLQREAKAAGRIEHENVTAAVDFGLAEDGTYFMAMEFLEGESLARLLSRTRPLSVPRAVQIVMQASRGVAAAHEAGIVHRDIKPDNLFLCRRPDGTEHVKVLDFGIAKVRSEAWLTQSGLVLGTPCYMSTEQACGAKNVDHRTDIYALGVVLYETLAGARPHDGDSYNEVIYQILTKEPEPLDSLRPRLPSGLAAIVHKAMARDPSDRFSTAEQLADTLERFAGPANEAKPMRVTSTEATVPIPFGVAPIADAAARHSPSLMVTSSDPITDSPSTDGPQRRRAAWFKPQKELAAIFTMAAIAGIAGAAWLVHDRRAAHERTTEIPVDETPAAPSARLPSQASQASQARQASQTSQTNQASPTSQTSQSAPAPRTEAPMPNTSAATSPPDLRFHADLGTATMPVKRFPARVPTTTASALPPSVTRLPAALAMPPMGASSSVPSGSAAGKDSPPRSPPSEASGPLAPARAPTANARPLSPLDRSPPF